MLTLFPTMRIYADALCDIAYTALAGALLNRLWLGRVSICDRPLRISLIACSAILLVDLPLQFLLLSASMIGRGGRGAASAIRLPLPAMGVSSVRRSSR